MDLLDGKAVQAVGGDREDYRPLSSPLCPNGNPFELLASYCRLGFSVIYLADLDALLGGDRQRGLLDRLVKSFPEVHFWLDCGWPPLKPDAQITPVIGSECLTSAFLDLLPSLPKPWILSLDFRHRFLGPPKLLKRPDLWPDRVIVMRLERVGRRKGPAFHQLAALRGCFPQKGWVAAGGVRHRGDLARLARLGIETVLIATALHGGQIP